jgi:hypothetical protein
MNSGSSYRDGKEAPKEGSAMYTLFVLFIAKSTVKSVAKSITDDSDVPSG